MSARQCCWAPGPVAGLSCKVENSRLKIRDRLCSPFAQFLALYGALYAAFGVQSPYLPSFLDSHGLTSEAIALVLAAGTAIRLVAGPAAGRLADTLDAPKAVLIVCTAAAGVIVLAYLPARG